ncbi:MAG: FkbM family methyltransferase [Rhizobiaceae bacterium]
MKTLFSGKKRFGPVELLFQNFIRRTNKHLAKANFKKSRHRLAIFSFDHIGLMINQYGVYEGEELGLVFDFLSPLHDRFEQTTILDIGANIGNHAVYFSEYFDEVHAFEPNPRTFELLGFNTSDIDNISCHKHGLSTNKGSAILFQDDKNMGASFVGEEKDRPGTKTKSIKIQLKTLDQIHKNLGDVSAIKLDVEGMELDVLKGGKEFLDAAKPLVFFELLQSDFKNGSTGSLEFLGSLGYRFCWIDKGETRESGLKSLAAFFKGIFITPKNRIVTDNVIPERYHPFVIAVPPAMAAKLSMET